MPSDCIEPFWGPPPAIRILKADDVHVWSALLDQDPPVVEALEAILSPDEKIKASGYKNAQAKAHYIVGRSLLRRILATYLGVAAAEISFHYGPFGKPFLASPERASLHFNISHSKSVLLCAVSHYPIGIDLEQAEPLAEAALIAERFFSEADKSIYRATVAEQKGLAFYKLWTRRESIAKCSGRGLAHQPVNGNFQGSIVPLTPAAGYVGSLAIESPSYRLQTWQWPIAA